jgi:hypothetical protein
LSLRARRDHNGLATLTNVEAEGTCPA